MEFLIFAAVCFIAWKLIDSNRSTAKARSKTQTTTEILETPKQTTIKTTIVETNEFEQHVSTTSGTSSIRATIDKPAEQQEQQELNTVTAGELHVLRATERGKERERLRRLNAPIPQIPSPSHQTEAKVGLPLRNQATSSIAMEANNKHCDKCKIKLPVSEFWASTKPSNPDGLSKWCKACLDKEKKLSNSDRYKKCKKCGKQREKWNFHKSPKTKDGLGKWCVPCHDKTEKEKRKSR